MCSLLLSQVQETTTHGRHNHVPSAQQSKPHRTGSTTEGIRDSSKKGDRPLHLLCPTLHPLAPLEVYLRGPFSKQGERDSTTSPQEWGWGVVDESTNLNPYSSVPVRNWGSAKVELTHSASQTLDPLNNGTNYSSTHHPSTRARQEAGRMCTKRGHLSAGRSTIIFRL